MSTPTANLQQARSQTRRSNIRAVITQYLAEKQYSVMIPLYTLALSWIISAIIVLLTGIKTGLPLPADVQRGNMNNPGTLMGFPWFMVVAGALCANRQFNAALAFGSTRKDFWTGTSLGFLVTAFATGLAGTAGLAVEKATNHWWIGIRCFDVTALGSGNYAATFLIIFTLSWASLLVGATYGTIFRSFGAGRLVASIIATIAVLLVCLAAFIWKSSTAIAFFSPWGIWAFIAGLALVGVIMLTMGYAVNRHAVI
jgi:drug/metabolite transporter (DMT)-like permease